MGFTVLELAALVGGQLAEGSNAGAVVLGVAGLADAGAGEITFFGNPRYLLQLRASKATAALVPQDFSERISPICIRCENPTLAFSKIVERFSLPPVQFPPGVHPTAIIGRDVNLGDAVSIQAYAVIEDGASIGARTVIGAYSYIGHAAKVGDDCHVHARVTIGFRCTVGDRVILHSGVVLGSDGFGFELHEGRHAKVPQIGIVQVDNDVEIGANTAIDRARFGKTWIGEGTKIDNLVQIAHNVIIGKHCIICGLNGISGSTKIGNYVTLAGQVGTVGHVEIGDGTTVGAQSGVTKSLPPKHIFMGTPAIPAREWKEQVAHIHSLQKLKARIQQLEQIVGAAGEFPPPKS